MDSTEEGGQGLRRLKHIPSVWNPCQNSMGWWTLPAALSCFALTPSQRLASSLFSLLTRHLCWLFSAVVHLSSAIQAAWVCWVTSQQHRLLSS